MENLVLREEVGTRLRCSGDAWVPRRLYWQFPRPGHQELAPSDSAVLITGEAGKGKELSRARFTSVPPGPRGLSSSVNYQRCLGDLIAGVCSATRKAPSPAHSNDDSGRFELAEGGTIFLDEIGDV